MFGSGVEGLDHNGNGGRQFYVFPQANDLPAGCVESLVDPVVALDILAELRVPVPFVGRRLAPVVGACVPEASVDEHRDLACGEDDIRTYLDRSDVEAEVLAVAISHAVQRFPQRDFRLRFRPAVRSHVPGPPFIERGGVQSALVSQLAGLCCFAVSHVNIGSTPDRAVGQDTGRDEPAYRQPHRKGLL